MYPEFNIYVLSDVVTMMGRKKTTVLISLHITTAQCNKLESNIKLLKSLVLFKYFTDLENGRHLRVSSKFSIYKYMITSKILANKNRFK